ncbi:MAG TPA: Gfo/Idh/MocA family oxidoreductase [Ktedonobacterales bacterium]|jgi:predicted dehydrogenase|nr:Gfo/Idh/MocA family oxidoreductase [Ktedonobacterales bacterium]
MSDLRFAVIGWGYWGPKIARNLDTLPGAQVTMVADMDPLRLVLLRQERKWSTTTRPADVFAADVDGVVIATPVRTHYALARDALLNGKHVLVEKPLTTSVAEAEDLIALARQMRRTLMVGHTFEYSPAVGELRKLIAAGELGRIYCIETERLNLGLFRSDIDVIWDLAPHDVSILLYLLGTAPAEIRAQACAHLRANIYDVAHLDLGFPEGMTAHIHVSWLHPCKVRRVTVMGDARMAVYDDTNPAEMLKIFNKGADIGADPEVSYRFGAITIPHIEWIEPLRLECEDFANAIRTDAAPRASGQAGLEVVKVLAAAQASLRRPVTSSMLAPA